MPVRPEIREANIALSRARRAYESAEAEACNNPSKESAQRLVQCTQQFIAAGEKYHEMFWENFPSWCRPSNIFDCCLFELRGKAP